MTMTPEKAQELMDAKWFYGDGDAEALLRAYIESAAEITRLRAKVEAANSATDGADGWSELIMDAVQEGHKAMRKFPQPNYVISKFAEEAGEVVKAAIHCAEGRETPANLRGEMKQAVAMLYRMWIEGDRVHGLPPVGAALTAYKETEE